MTKSDWMFLVALSFVLSVCGVIGVSYVAGEGWPILSVSLEIIFIAVFTLVFAILLLLFDFVLNRLLAISANRTDRFKASYLVQNKETDSVGPVQRVDTEQDESADPAQGARTDSAHYKTRNSTKFSIKKLVPSWTPRSILIFSAVMALFWLPWYIANFPGGTYWDTYYQIYQVYPENHPISVVPWEEMRAQTTTDAWIVDHHPFITTMLYGGFGWLSDQLTGNWMAGIAMFCALQGIAHILVFASAIAYFRKIDCPAALCFIGYSFFCIMPFISTWAMCMVKDSLFGVLFTIYFLMLFELIRSRGDYLTKPRNALVFLLLGLLLCLTRKNGLFVVIPTTLIAAIVFRKNAKAVIGLVAQSVFCLLIMCLLIPSFLFPALNIQPGGKQEILGPLLQQTARVAKDYGDEITPLERSQVNRIIDYGRLANNYRFDFQDSVKYRYDQTSTSEDIAAYLELYVKQGLQHPDSYLAAYASLAGFYVAPTAYANIRMVTVDTKMGDEQRYMLWNPDELDWLRNGLDDAYKTIAVIPVLNIPLLIVTYVLWLPAMLGYVAKRRRLKSGVLFIPSIVLLAFCTISPVYDARYAVPLFDIAPLLLCAVATLLYNAIQKKRRNHGE